MFVVKSSLFLLMRGWCKLEAHSSKQSDWFSKTAASHEVVSLSREKQIKWKAFILLVLKEACTFDFTGVWGVTDVQVGFPPIHIFHNFSIFDIFVRFLFFIFLIFWSFPIFFRIFHISIFLPLRFCFAFDDIFHIFYNFHILALWWYFQCFSCFTILLHILVFIKIFVFVFISSLILSCFRIIAIVWKQNQSGRFLRNLPRSQSLFYYCFRYEELIPAATAFHKYWYSIYWKKRKSWERTTRQARKNSKAVPLKRLCLAHQWKNRTHVSLWAPNIIVRLYWIVWFVPKQERNLK